MLKRPTNTLVLVGLLSLASSSSSAQAPKSEPAPSLESGIKVGDRRAILAREGWVPVLTDSIAYTRFTAAVHARSLSRLRSLMFRDDVLTLVHPGRTVEVVAIHAGQDPRAASYLPCAEVRDADNKAAVARWVPLASLRTADEPPAPGEMPLPMFHITPAATPVKAKPGMHMALWKDGGVAVTTDFFAYESYIKFALAGDTTGVQNLKRTGRLVIAPILTRVLILERHENMFIGKGIPAIEARILDGDYAGKTFWAPESRVTLLDLRVVLASAPKPVRRLASDVASQLRLGQSVEKAGNLKAAIGYYRQVIRDHPGSDEAATAGERIAKLEKQFAPAKPKAR